jgi:hypothetical protein
VGVSIINTKVYQGKLIAFQKVLFRPKCHFGKNNTAQFINVNAIFIISLFSIRKIVGLYDNRALSVCAPFQFV